MEAAELAKYDKTVLAAAVKVAQRKRLIGPGGGWKEWLAAQEGDDTKLTDPRRHGAERLAAFLASLDGQAADAAAAPAGGKPLKPGKVLARLLPWLQKVEEEERELEQHTTKASGSEAAILELVKRTRSHPAFRQKYSFDSWEKGWLRTDRVPLPSPDAPLVLFGLDCEMCKTEESDKDLLQVALVDADGNVLLKELIKPSARVLDLRTELTGVTPEQLEGATMDRHAAAKRIRRLLKPGAVLVGHSLHSDLQALHLDHQPVIDTAALFRYEGLAGATPALTHLAEALLDRKMRRAAAAAAAGEDDVEMAEVAAAAAAAAAAAEGEGEQQQLPHDSVEDAAAAMALVQLELKRTAAGQGPTPPLQPPAIKVDKEQLRKLCIHRLPEAFPGGSEAVRAAFASACRKGGAAEAAALITAATVEAAGAGGARQVLLVFEHPGTANSAFAGLPGKVFTDSLGRHSKRLRLRVGDVAVVRKMACHGGMVFGRDKAADRGAKKKDGPKGKRSKTKGGKGGLPLTTKEGRVAKKQQQKKQKLSKQERKLKRQQEKKLKKQQQKKKLEKKKKREAAAA